MAVVCGVCGCVCAKQADEAAHRLDELDGVVEPVLPHSLQRKACILGQRGCESGTGKRSQRGNGAGSSRRTSEAGALRMTQWAASFSLWGSGQGEEKQKVSRHVAAA